MTDIDMADTAVNMDDPTDMANLVDTDMIDNMAAKAAKNFDVYILQDVSGSMTDQSKSVANGINEIIDDLKKRYDEPCEYTATITFSTFSSNTMIRIGKQTPIKQFHPIKPPTCDGLTAMWDSTGIKLELMKEKSNNVAAVLYIFTDGSDNDSIKYRRDDIRKMIAAKSEMHSVLFVGSDPTSAETATSLGVDRNCSIQHSSDNTPIAYEVCRRALARCVIGDTQTTTFSASDIQLTETPQSFGTFNHSSSSNLDDNDSSM
jgi:uncharacterized protein YegL